MWNFKGWVSLQNDNILNDSDNDLKTLFTAMLRDAGFTMLTDVDATFKPQGFTALWLLAESHFAIHTFPEKGALYFELTSCNEEKQECFTRAMNEMFKVRATWE